MLNVHHRPMFNVEKIKDFYSEKDGIPVKYVCTSAIREYDAVACDIFYRETPHPKFGNRYFGLYRNNSDTLMITDADNVEKLDFDMVEVDGEFHYSQHRHDYHCVGGVCIDGGRAYLRRSGDLSKPVSKLKVIGGEFILIKD